MLVLSSSTTGWGRLKDRWAASGLFPTLTRGAASDWPGKDASSHRINGPLQEIPPASLTSLWKWESPSVRRGARSPSIVPHVV